MIIAPVVRTSSCLTFLMQQKSSEEISSRRRCKRGFVRVRGAAERVQLRIELVPEGMLTLGYSACSEAGRFFDSRARNQAFIHSTNALRLPAAVAKCSNVALALAAVFFW